MENLEFKSVGPEHINTIRELWEGLRSRRQINGKGSKLA